MAPENAKQELEKRIKQSGTAMSALTPAQGVRLMLEFYRDVRADNCNLDEDGDMLLFEWGNYNWSEGRSFQFGITRQFILNHSKDEDDDDAMSHLSFKFHFPPSTKFDAIKPSNRWCNLPDELATFESFIIGSDVYRTVGTERPSKVVLNYHRL